MRRLQFFSLIVAIFLVFAGCEEKNVAIPYSEFSERMESSVGLTGLDFEYTLDAVFADESAVRLSGSAQVLLDDEKNVEEFSADVAFSVPGDNTAGSSSRMEMDLYWVNNNLYSSSMGMKYLSTAKAHDSLPILPSVLFAIPEEAVLGEIVLPDVKTPTCVVTIDPEELKTISLLFGRTFQTITGAEENYKVHTLTVTYTLDDKGKLSQMDLSAELTLPSSFLATDSEPTSPLAQICVSAEILFTETGREIDIRIPSNLNSYNRHHSNNPMA